MKRNLLVLFLFMILCPLTYGQNHWTVEHTNWSQNMSVIAVVQVDGDELRTSDIEIAAFNDNELRSNGVRLKYENLWDRYMAYITIYGDEEFMMTFKLYDHSSGEELDYTCRTTLKYSVNGTVGEVDNPYIIEFSAPVIFTGNGSWDETSNWKNSVMP